MGSTVPLPMVAATLSWNTHSAAKLKNAANSTAWRGDMTPVATMVEIQLAPSWKPIHEIERQRDEDQDAEDPDADGQLFHGGSPQAFSIRISSMVRAVAWYWSSTDSCRK